jgi:hypothetical protein
MKRSILAFVAALVAWILIVSLLDRGLRIALNGYAAAEPTMSFTVSMMAARLVIAAITSLLAGGVAAWIAPRSSATPAVLGAVLLVIFIPVHVKVWAFFPVWYHLTFLLTLLPLVVLGARLVQGLRRAPAVALK